MKSQVHWFRFVPQTIFVLFMGIMIYVTYRAYTRNSGSTGQDMSTIQQVRYHNSPFAKRSNENFLNEQKAL